MFNLKPWRRGRMPHTTVMPREANPLVRLREEFESMFDRFLGRWPTPLEEVGLGRFWAFDVRDEDRAVVVRAELPGFEAGDIDVHVCGAVLTIQAEKKQEQNQAKEGHRVEERHASLIRRTVTLPGGADPDGIEARYRNGVLEVHVPKTGTAGKQVPVKE
jgi:HSP20 family protein